MYSWISDEYNEDDSYRNKFDMISSLIDDAQQDRMRKETEGIKDKIRKEIEEMGKRRKWRECYRWIRF